MNLNSLDKLTEILKKGYSMDYIGILLLAEKGLLNDESLNNLPKIKSLVQTCERKGLLTENKGITLEGQELLKFYNSDIDSFKSIKKKEAKSEGFDKWWKAFPGTDTFEYKGKKFKGTRALRVKKDDCKAKINKIINEGECTIEDMIGALKLEIHQKMENSYKTATNKMSYFQNSLTYLNQRTFEPYLELLRAGHKAEEVDIKPTFSGGVEI